jgi:hypothetical protein
MANGEWTEDQKKVMRWLSLPPQLRQPSTFRKLCTSLNNGKGYHHSSVYDWFRLVGWKEAVSKMACQILLDMEPFIAQAALSNMITPEGWQERIGHERYRKKGLLDLKSQGYLDEVSDTPSDDALKTEQRRTFAAERLALMPDQQREEFRELLSDLVGLDVYAPTIFRTSELSVSGSEVDERPLPFTVEKWVDIEQEDRLEAESRTLSQGARDFIQHRDGMKSVTPQGLQALKKKTIRKKRGRYNKGKDNTNSI